MSSTNLYKTYNRTLKTIIVILAIGFLYHQFFIKNTIDELIDNWNALFEQESFLYYSIFVLLLMPLNWFLEALKWKYVVSAKEDISIFTAMKAIYAGATISSISINRTGEFIGRIFVLKKHSFWEGVVVTVVGSYAQTLNTYFWGCLSVLFLFWPVFQSSTILPLALFYFLLAALIFLFFWAVFFYYKISWLNRLIRPSWKRIIKIVVILRLVKNKVLTKVLLLSTLRYIVFSTQFFLLLRGSGIELNYWVSFGLISTMFLFNSIRPSIALVEVGLRSASALIVFEYYYKYILDSLTYPQVEVVTATSFIWLINIVLPAFIGLFFIKDLKFFNRKTTS